MKPPVPHFFVEDPTVRPDAHGRRYCRCGLPEQSERHQLPPMTADQHDVEARRLGEREGATVSE